VAAITGLVDLPPLGNIANESWLMPNYFSKRKFRLFRVIWLRCAEEILKHKPLQLIIQKDRGRENTLIGHYWAICIIYVNFQNLVAECRNYKRWEKSSQIFILLLYNRKIVRNLQTL
jgi:hypothetical protein